jgi:SAM-dependent methyltransferase
MDAGMTQDIKVEDLDLEKAAQRGNPSFVWRAGQERRLKMIRDAAGRRAEGCVFVDGCGVGMYLGHLVNEAQLAVGLDIELERTLEAHQLAKQVVCGAGEHLPFPANTFDLILSHEVLEHVQDDTQAVREIIRTLRPGGRLMLFVPNRGYPYETHGVYWKGVYHFGNIPLVNYLPRWLRDRLAPHVRVYTRTDLQRLFSGLPVRLVQQTTVFGAYDNIIARWPGLGRVLRAVLQALESTPLKIFGLSHFWVVEKIPD